MNQQTLVQHSFNRAATSYAKHALVQKTSATMLIKVFEHELRQMKHPVCVLDAGCGSCFHAKLPNKTRHAIALDIALDMLQQLKQQQRLKPLCAPVCATLERLPLASASLDIVFSNASIHWCAQPSQVLAEFRRVLKPSGLLLLNSYGPRTLCELRNSWKLVDNTPHTLDFMSQQQLSDELRYNDFAIINQHKQRKIVWHEDVMELLNNLKRLGVRNLHHGRHRGLSSANKITAMIRNYTEQYQHNRKIPASYEWFFFCARPI